MFYDAGKGLINLDNILFVRLELSQDKKLNREVGEIIFTDTQGQERLQLQFSTVDRARREYKTLTDALKKTGNLIESIRAGEQPETESYWRGIEK